MQKRDMSELKRDRGFAVLGLILIAVPALAYCGYHSAIFNHPGSIIGLGLMTIVILITSTIGFFFIQSYDKSTLTFGEGEIRKGITFSIMVLFFGLIAYGNDIKIENSGILSKVLENFWVIVTSVIAFYFGGRAAEIYADTKNSAANAQAKIQVLEAEARTAEQRNVVAQNIKEAAR
jgi:hypothetical protein